MLSVRDLKFAIGATSILNGVNLEVQPGEKLGIIGPNGSGKTTLFNCLCGFNLPKSGSIEFKEQDITRSAPHKRSKLGLGRVFQNFGVFREMTVQENVLTAIETRTPSGLLPWSASQKNNKQRALDFLEDVGLQDRAAEKAGSLSGGQMRLLEIIRAVAFNADLFLLDEPTAGVSPKMKHEVERVIKTLQEMNKTVMIIEHDINFIQKLCDRIVVLDQGQIVLDGTPEKVRNDPQLQEIYFGAN